MLNALSRTIALITPRSVFSPAEWHAQRGVRSRVGAAYTFLCGAHCEPMGLDIAFCTTLMACMTWTISSLANARVNQCLKSDLAVRHSHLTSGFRRTDRQTSTSASRHEGKTKQMAGRVGAQKGSAGKQSAHIMLSCWPIDQWLKMMLCAVALALGDGKVHVHRQQHGQAKIRQITTQEKKRNKHIARRRRRSKCRLRGRRRGGRGRQFENTNNH